MAEKNKGGRPPFYKTVEELQAAIDAYFNDCNGRLLTDGEGNPILNKYDEPIYLDKKPYTVTGLALYLGFTSRQALLNYQNKQAFVDAVTRAKLIIEDYANQRLYDRDGVNGAKFTLINNFSGYADKQEINHSGEMKQVVIVDDIKG